MGSKGQKGKVTEIRKRRNDRKGIALSYIMIRMGQVMAVGSFLSG
jgi:hypothetical protein